MPRIPDDDDLRRESDRIVRNTFGMVDVGDALGNCILARAGDLAHRMMVDGIDVKVAAGKIANGTPCTVIYAVGWTAEAAAALGEALVAKVEKERKRMADEAQREGPPPG